MTFDLRKVDFFAIHLYFWKVRPYYITLFPLLQAFHLHCRKDSSKITFMRKCKCQELTKQNRSTSNTSLLYFLALKNESVMLMISDSFHFGLVIYSTFQKGFLNPQTFFDCLFVLVTIFHRKALLGATAWTRAQRLDNRGRTILTCSHLLSSRSFFKGGLIDIISESKRWRQMVILTSFACQIECTTRRSCLTHKGILWRLPYVPWDLSWMMSGIVIHQTVINKCIVDR